MEENKEIQNEEKIKQETVNESFDKKRKLEKFKLFLSKFSVKQKIIGGIIILIIYTLIVGLISAKIQKHIIINEIQKSFKEAFSFGEDSSNEIKDSTKNDKKEEAKKEEKQISLNQTVTIGNVMELTLESSEWLEEIRPSNASGFYTYYQDKEGEKYFVIRAKVKNIASEDLDVTYIDKSEIIINDTYKSDVFFESEEVDGSSFESDIKSLQTVNVIIYTSVSDEVYNICKKAKLTMNILSNSEDIGGFYDDDKAHETYTIEFNN